MSAAPQVVEVAPTPLVTSAGSAAPPSTGTINVVPPPITPAPPPKPGSAKSKMFENLRSRATVDGKPVTAPAAPATATAPAAAPVTPPAPPAATPPAAPAEKFDLGDDIDLEELADEVEPVAPVTPAEPAKPGEPEKKKVNPWKLLDEYKERVRKSELEALEAKKLVPNEEARKQELAELEGVRKRAKELEEEIRHVNFAKSEEFKTKYEQPYNQAWQRAMSEVSEIAVVDPETGAERKATAADIMEIVNMPLGPARKAAEEKFGSFANDVMGHRKAIRELYDAQNSALESARKNGEEVAKARTAEMTAHRQKLQEEVVATWKHYNEAVTKDPKAGKLFSPTEGDEDGNKKLEAGYKLVDQAMAMNPLDPRLTPEQRKEAVRLQVAIRNRAAAFGRLATTHLKLQSENAKLRAELAQYKSSEPGIVAGRTITPAAPQGVKASIMGALHKIAK